MLIAQGQNEQASLPFCVWYTSRNDLRSFREHGDKATETVMRRVITRTDVNVLKGVRKRSQLAGLEERRGTVTEVCTSVIGARTRGTKDPGSVLEQRKHPWVTSTNAA